ncbi:Hypothetical predicted protein, partial [Paramuricea clavata]
MSGKLYETLWSAKDWKCSHPPPRLFLHHLHKFVLHRRRNQYHSHHNIVITRILVVTISVMHHQKVYGLKSVILGWIPNPRTEMNRSYNRIYTYELFYLERVGYFAETNKGFKKTFHAEARREHCTTMKRVVQIKKNKWTNLNLKSILSFRARIFLREDHVLKPHDSKTIRQNMLAIENIETSIDKMEKSIKEHMEKTIRSSIKTHFLLYEKEVSLEEAKQQQEQEKEEESKCIARIAELLKNIAQGCKEGKACAKDNFIKELGKRERKWAIALTSSRCNLLDGSAKFMVCNILDVGGNASDDSGSWYEVDQDGSRRDDNASDYCESDVGRTDNINRSDVAVMMEVL